MHAETFLASLYSFALIITAKKFHYSTLTPDREQWDYAKKFVNWAPTLASREDRNSESSLRIRTGLGGREGNGIMDSNQG